MSSLLASSYYGPSVPYYTSDTPLTPLTPVTQTLSHVRCETLEPEMMALKSMLSTHRAVPYGGRKSSHSKDGMNNRLAYVEALVDTNALVIETMWYGQSSNGSQGPSTPAVVPLRTFIQEVLKRSRTTYSTLQTALFYLFRAQPAVAAHLSPASGWKRRKEDRWEDAYISCGRRMFLASLVIASKFVQDKTYRNSAWAKIAGLPIAEINAAERIFLDLIDYRLYISQATFEQWHQLLHMHVEQKTQHPLLMSYDLPSSPLSSPPTLSHLPHPHPHPHPPHSHHPTHHHHHAHPAPTAAASYGTPSSSNVSNSSASTPVTTPPLMLPHYRKRKYSLVDDSPHSPLNTPLPVLTLSLPSSNHSSPLQTPTQISPIRAQLWKSSPKKRKCDDYYYTQQQQQQQPHAMHPPLHTRATAKRPY